jgi:hypothetical protein
MVKAVSHVEIAFVGDGRTVERSVEHLTQGMASKTDGFWASNTSKHSWFAKKQGLQCLMQCTCACAQQCLTAAAAAAAATAAALIAPTAAAAGIP